MPPQGRWEAAWKDGYRRNAKFGPGIVIGTASCSTAGSPWQEIGARHKEQSPMSVHIRELYHSANGDRWCLANDSASGRVFVRHEPNLASGGKISDIDIGAFLSRGGQGQEKQELLRLIGTLVEERLPT
jgi:hypothetical protein